LNKNILVVDDEKNIADNISFVLKKEGYDVVTAYDGEQALTLYAEASPDLILLDVMLPKLSGLDVCARIRKTDLKTPILMLTARTEEADMVLGLETGADDYITKPYSLRALLARVKANIRRTGQESQPEGLQNEGIAVDMERLDVYVNGKSAELTQREFELFKYLYAQPGCVISREELLREVWQYDYLGDLRTVDVAVRRLRAKFEQLGATSEYIVTKRGIGYYFEG
jgi:two-component system response regulator VicR